MSRIDLFTGLALLLLAAHAHALVRGAVRGAAQPFQARYVQPGLAYPVRGVAYPAQGVASTTTQMRFQAGSGANGYATPAQSVASTFQAASGANGYAKPASVADPNVLCDGKWRTALRREVMNVDNWECVKRILPDGTFKSCVITGPTSSSVFKNISACAWKMPTFCDNTVTELMTSLRVPSATNATIPSDYTLVAGAGYYKVHVEELSWQEARDACVAEAVGGHLAIPSTAADYLAINNLINVALPSQSKGAFIGISDIAVEASFVTVTGQPLCMLGQAIFLPNQPDNAGGSENCLEIGYQGGAFLNDIPCAGPLPFVCELPIPGTTVC